MQFRKLKAEEIDVRVGGVGKDNPTGAWLLLYKDARCDMNILDETLGPFGWQRHHEVINGQLFCTVSIWDDEKKQWVEKQDMGTESNTEKEKGRASDAFKRACFNIGIGRELYTAPFIWVKDNSITNKMQWNRKNFKVTKVDYNEMGQISELNIAEVKNGNETNIFYYKEKTVNSKPKNTRSQAKPIEPKELPISEEDAKALQASMTLNQENAEIGKQVMRAHKISRISNFTQSAMVEYYTAIQGIGL